MQLGVEKFIDYRKENYADILTDVDYLLDTLGNREIPKEFSILKPGGHLVSLRGMPNGRFAKRRQRGKGRPMTFFLYMRMDISWRKSEDCLIKSIHWKHRGMQSLDYIR